MTFKKLAQMFARPLQILVMWQPSKEQQVVENEQPQQAEDVTPVSEIIEGSKVVVFDRYRFAIPLLAKVEHFSKYNDGVEVELLQSNNKNYPIGCSIWVHKAQLQLAT